MGIRKLERQRDDGDDHDHDDQDDDDDDDDAEEERDMRCELGWLVLTVVGAITAFIVSLGWFGTDRVDRDDGSYQRHVSGLLYQLSDHYFLSYFFMLILYDRISKKKKSHKYFMNYDKW